jgi:mRNA-degrading endonuclease RelE of RelBE toxin-antitoxin system
MSWRVELSRRTEKAVADLPLDIQTSFWLLVKEITQQGPVRFNWPHYSRLHPKHEDRHHCHIKSGRPTYVVCWEVKDKRIKFVEVYYAGTHEKAPY